mmetsp:Transcript_5519/g.12992  ORF Transcript_5519/g.12992 Transcript_5519/m.12992 type:complete len:245 (-) Transcript_5519:172-906(-)|eukprot:CAMPEP_0113648994 /NCGR_PEP_ID=MMETSP0017_2-20120614/26017_1 /TAXON_ID=2856 /ORGANISM="Cylindrotheca closterium" /LENGTH=244 /DNA_ID=CAMNT_0000561307 /DNA_START=37 /DNA_END=771 /DNA_ORIENTATION=+ /assembly_acc=CAM_ASM_000147
MVAPTSVCLQLGNTADAASNGAKILTASTSQEVEASRQGMVPSSIDQLSVVVSASDLATLYNPMELANWVPLFRENASVSIKVMGDNADLTPIHTSFLLAGLSGASEQKTPVGRILTATRKATTVAAAAPLKPKNAVTISLDDGDEDMIDEDALLSDDLLAPPPAMGTEAATDDCAGREPCADCSCGRADADKDTSAEPQQAKTSSCGKCNLGDAFRCASCPYLGKPAFKPGEEHLVLNLTDDL